MRRYHCVINGYAVTVSARSDAAIEAAFMDCVEYFTGTRREAA